MPAPTSSAPAAHRERLHVPIGWWLLGLGFALTLVVAVTAYTNLWVGGAVSLVSLLVIGIVLGGYGHAVVAADESGLTAGLAHVEWPWVASVTALDAKQTRSAIGPGAKATAHLLLRPYLRTAVRVDLADPADPHPYWLVSCRHPERVAAVAERQLSARTASTPGS